MVVLTSKQCNSCLVGPSQCPFSTGLALFKITKTSSSSSSHRQWSSINQHLVLAQRNKHQLLLPPSSTKLQKMMDRVHSHSMINLRKKQLEAEEGVLTQLSGRGDNRHLNQFKRNYPQVIRLCNRKLIVSHHHTIKFKDPHQVKE